MVLPVMFPHKLYAMLEYAADSEHASAVSWIDEGRAFAIHDKDAFLEHLVPRFFKQTKYRSFTRQLLLWGFDRIAGWGCAVMMRWRHEHFVRGKTGSLHLIKRVENKSKKEAEHAKKVISPITQPDVSPAASAFETDRRSSPSPPFASPAASFARPPRNSQEGSFAEIGFVKIGATTVWHNMFPSLIARPSKSSQNVLPTKSGPSSKDKANSVAPLAKQGVQEPIASSPVMQSAPPSEDNGASRHDAYLLPAISGTEPPSEEQPAQMALPPGWKAAVDGDSGRVYYYRRQDLPSEVGSAPIFGTGGCPAPRDVSVDIIVPGLLREGAEATREGAKIAVPDAAVITVPDALTSSALDVVTSCGAQEISGSS